MWEGKSLPGPQRPWPFITQALAWPLLKHAESPRKGFAFPHTAIGLLYFASSLLPAHSKTVPDTVAVHTQSMIK
jgi:hypothetical protein